METTERMHFLFAADRGFDLYTDHNNFVFLFDPKTVLSDILQTTLGKVLRWSVRLSAYAMYMCKYLNIYRQTFYVAVHLTSHTPLVVSPHAPVFIRS